MKTAAWGVGRGAHYEIRIGGQLGAEWTEWFGGLILTPTPHGDTVLTGFVADQAAIVMIVLSHVLTYRVNRWANIIVAGLMIVFVIGGGSTSPHYLFIATVEVVCLLLIIGIAWRWSKPESQF